MRYDLFAPAIVRWSAIVEVAISHRSDTAKAESESKAFLDAFAKSQLVDLHVHVAWPHSRWSDFQTLRDRGTSEAFTVPKFLDLRVHGPIAMFAGPWPHS
uniref:Uncharacterized protein n=1 Tax=Solanum tuberosum TaxID=4113 RepID=M1DY07_SOLTU